MGIENQGNVVRALNRGGLRNDRAGGLSEVVGAPQKKEPNLLVLINKQWPTIPKTAASWTGVYKHVTHGPRGMAKKLAKKFKNEPMRPSKVRTLEDMTEEEIQALEREYGCAVRRPEKKEKTDDQT